VGEVTEPPADESSRHVERITLSRVEQVIGVTGEGINFHQQIQKLTSDIEKFVAARDWHQRQSETWEAKYRQVLSGVNGGAKPGQKAE
jgi:hypothetical protein